MPQSLLCNPYRLHHDYDLRSAGRLAPAPRVRRQLFMRSLICNVPPDARLLRCCADEEVAEKRPSGGGGGGGRPAAVRQGPSPYPKLEFYLAAMASQVLCGTLRVLMGPFDCLPDRQRRLSRRIPAS